MICFNCGREITDGNKFCVYCGASTAVKALSPDTEEIKDGTPNVNEIIEETAENAALLPERTVGYPAVSENISRAINPDIPIQNTDLNTNLSKQGPERKYTIKHIIMCLISTAVCAIAAGIFAGLYFSVV